MRLTTISARRETAGAGLGRAMGAVDLHAASRSGGGSAEKPPPQATYPGLTMVTNRRDLAAVRTQAEEVEQMMASDGSDLPGLVEAIATQIASVHRYAMRSFGSDLAKALAVYEQGVENTLRTARLAPNTFLNRHAAIAKAGQERQAATAPVLMPLAELLAKRRALVTAR